MANKTVSFRLPSELIEVIEAKAQVTGQSKTKVVIAALTQSYGCPHSLPQSVTTEKLQQQLNDLKHQITLLSKANKLHQLITEADSPIQSSPAVKTIISAIPIEERLTWIYDVLNDAAQKELRLQTLKPSFSETCYLPVSSHAKK